MKSDRIVGHASFGPVRILAYSLHPFSSVSSCICISHSVSMVRSVHHLFRWNPFTYPNALHLCMKFGVACWMSGHCYCSAYNKVRPGKLYLATFGDYLILLYSCTFQNPSPVSSCFAVHSSRSSELHLHISSTTFQPTVAKSIWHYQNFPKPARSWKSPTNLQPPSPSAVVHLAAGSNLVLSPVNPPILNLQKSSYS